MTILKLPNALLTTEIPPCYRVGRGGGGSGIPVYPKKNSPKYPKIPKIHPNIPKIIPRYNLYLKSKETDIPNTRI